MMFAVRLSSGFENACAARNASACHVLAVDDGPSVRQMIADYLGRDDTR
jgi:hypothetical protein